MIKIDFNGWVEKINEMKYKILEDNKNKDKILLFGVPRGGSLISSYLNGKDKFEMIDKPVEGCVVVDDLIDSGATRNKYMDYPFYALIDKRKNPENPWIEFWYENTEKDSLDLVTRQLQIIGEDPNREGLIDTPKRVIKMWKEIFRGYDKNQLPKITTFNNGSDGVIYDSQISDTGRFNSYCEHHMKIFSGRYWFSYLPNLEGKLIGLSKVARVVDYFSAKLQIQERLVHDILSYIYNSLCDDVDCSKYPLGMALVMEAEHFCKTARGVKKEGIMRTTKLIGAYKEDMSTRQEFMGWVNSFQR